MIDPEDVAEGIKARLENANLGYDIAFPNVDYPAPGQTKQWPRLRVEWAASNNRNQFIKGDAAEFQQGRVSIAVITEQGKGETVPNQIAAQVKALFPDNLSIPMPSCVIRITDPCDVIGGYRDGPNWRVPVMVKYEARAI